MNAVEIKSSISNLIRRTIREEKTGIDNTFNKTIENFIKKKKLKVTGIRAMNVYIRKKDPKYKIYNNNNYIKYEVYSNTAYKHNKQLCDILHKNENIKCYKKKNYFIKIDGNILIEITDVPTEIYDNIKTNIYDNIHYVDINTLMIYIYRKYNSGNYGNIDKHYARGTLLESLYKFKKPTVMWNQEKPLKKILKTIFNTFLQENKNVILTGDYAYNHYVSDGYKKILDSFDIICVDIGKTHKRLISLLKNSESVSYESLFLKNNISIIYKNKVICNLIQLENKYINKNVDINNNVLVVDFNKLIEYLYINLLENGNVKYNWMIYYLLNKKNF